MLFAETTTLGVRSFAVERSALERHVLKVETQYGAIDVKVARMNGHVVNEMPEFDQVQAAAVKAGVPFRTVESAVRLALADASKVETRWLINFPTNRQRKICADVDLV
jgi:uncharacterized protein (DUF111 family)